MAMNWFQARGMIFKGVFGASLFLTPVMAAAADQESAAESVSQQSKTNDIAELKKKAGDSDPQAMYTLGVRYFNGDGVSASCKEALKWWRKAAALGNAEAMFHLGVCCSLGEGVPPDAGEALKWWGKAAALGNADAMNVMGDCCLNGVGMPKNATEAVAWWRKSAALGNNAHAMFQLGICYSLGDGGLPKDCAEAVAWWRKSADLGYADAMFFLGSCYANGKGVPPDDVHAYMWLSLAASKEESRLAFCERVRKRMSSGQVSEAQKMAAEYSEKMGWAPVTKSDGN